MDNKYIDAHRIRQVFFIAILFLLGWIIFRELSGFLPAFLGSLTLYVIMRKFMFRLVQVRKWKPGAAAALLMFTSFLVILIPVWLVINLMSSKINFAITHSTELMNGLENFIHRIERQLGQEFLNEKNLQAVGGMIATRLPSVIGATFNTLATIAMMYFLLFFMLTNGRSMERTVSSFLPMHESNLNKVGKEVKNMVFSNAIGIPLIAIIQGVVGLLCYWVIGVKEPLFWFAITCITSMLPLIGAAFAYVPLSIIFFANGENVRGIIMLAYGFGVIGTVDNIFRFTLARKIGDVHPIITVLGVLAGISLFGFIGLIFGPLLISLFLLLIRIYAKEFTEIKDPSV
ncbi:MAG: AI-2E family transporter [Gemmatimonadaceae bacterium]|nr:AI-2E family transporter [Chitinophagaceae bacterium]